MLELFADTRAVSGACELLRLAIRLAPAVFYLYLLARRWPSMARAKCSVVVMRVHHFLSTRPERVYARNWNERWWSPASWPCAFAITQKRLRRRSSSFRPAQARPRTDAKAAREEERQRIASDFHDGPLQSFISLQMRLEIVRKLLERDVKSGVQELQQVQDLARSQVRELRAFLHSMRPVELDGANLSVAARRVIDNFQKESGIPVTLVGGDAALGLPDGMVAEVLQMMREALHNVQKHASASRVAVSIEKGEKLLEISVDDNGRGFHFSGATIWRSWSCCSWVRPV